VRSSDLMDLKVLRQQLAELTIVDARSSMLDISMNPTSTDVYPSVYVFVYVW
jgi:hypothetical protein